jgi:pilus assembly protein CpaE
MSRDAMPQSEEKIRVLILPGQDPVGDWMATVINLDPGLSLLALVRDLDQVQSNVEKLAPKVILVDLSSGILQRKELLSEISGGAAVVVVATPNELDLVQQAMLHGAKAFLLKPFGETDLLNTVRRVKPPVKPAQPAPSIPIAESDEQASVLAVYAPKGGVGCTTVAINLAVALHKRSQQQVTLVDGDLGFGDVDTALNLPASLNIATLVPQMDRLDDASLEASLVRHRSGIRVLPAPPHLDAADTIEPDHLRDLILHLQRLDAGYVVADTWSQLDDRTLSIFDCCSQLVVVTTPQVTALGDTRRFLEVMDLLNYDREGIVLVLNNCYHRMHVRPQDVERALGHPVAQVLDYEPATVTAAINHGLSLVEENLKSGAAQGILKLAELVEEGEAAQVSLRPKRAVVPAEGPGLTWRAVRKIGG